jgi:hypothetical protein
MIKQTCCFALFASFALLSLAVSASSDNLSRFLPGDGEIESWKKQRPAQQYAGEDLYEYIDGGAEIYHEYGFKRVVVQDYVNAAGKSVSLEIFEMAGPESAYGMYTFKTNSEDRAVPLGDGGRLADYYLNFWKGAFLVTLTGFDETAETVEGLLALARGLGSKLDSEESGERPLIASLMPVENLDGRSLKYFRGLLGLRSSHPFFNLEIAGFEEGIKGDYGEGYSLFLIRFGDEGECRKSCGRLREEYANIPGFEKRAGSGIFLARDRRDRPFFVSTLGNYLLLTMGEIDLSESRRLIQAVEEKIVDRSSPRPKNITE